MAGEILQAAGDGRVFGYHLKTKELFFLQFCLIMGMSRFFLPGSPKPLDLCSRLLFCPALLSYPQKRITAETECIDKQNLQTYVDGAVVRPLMIPSGAESPICSNR